MKIPIPLITWIVVCILANSVLGQTLRRFEYPIDHSMTLDQLIAELGDDDVLRNAQAAIKAIMSYPSSPVDRLYEALDDPDWQTRQIACDLIWNIRSAHEPIESTNDMFRSTNRRWRIKPTDPRWRLSEIPEITSRLVEVTIEGFRNDPTPYDNPHNRALMYTNAVHGMKRMIPVAHRWRGELETAMESDDPQQQLVAAIVLARAGVVESIQRTTQILLPHLRDNDIEDDAKFCIWALGGFGKALIPLLEDALPSADAQQRDCITLLILDLIDPPQSIAEGIERSRYNSITQNVHDPITCPPHADTWSWLNAINEQ